MTIEAITSQATPLPAVSMRTPESSGPIIWPIATAVPYQPKLLLASRPPIAPTWHCTATAKTVHPTPNTVRPMNRLSSDGKMYT